MKDLWFIALLPPAGLAAEINTYRHYAAGHFGSSHALKSPPHLTLFPPFRLPQKEMKALSLELRQFGRARAGFEVALKNFGSFPPKVVYLAVPKNIALESLQAALNHFIRHQLGLEADRPDRGFTPHLSIAHRDLAKADFARAWGHFKEIPFEAKFEAEALVVLRHDGKRWQEWERIGLGVS